VLFACIVCLYCLLVLFACIVCLYCLLVLFACNVLIKVVFFKGTK
jgi:hypothetical protein